MSVVRVGRQAAHQRLSPRHEPPVEVVVRFRCPRPHLRLFNDRYPEKELRAAPPQPGHKATFIRLLTRTFGCPFRMTFGPSLQDRNAVCHGCLVSTRTGTSQMRRVTNAIGSQIQNSTVSRPVLNQTTVSPHALAQHILSFQATQVK